ncbi:MAG: septal ring lytic transglycosylase RlpA family protein [Terriglobales bacterium]
MKRVLASFVVAAVLATTLGAKPVPKVVNAKKVVKYKKANAQPYQLGKASWYGKRFHGRKTANGESYNMFDMTAAHRHLPMGTWVKVTNLRNGRSVVLRINDRGPFVDSRVIDTSYTAAEHLGFREQGIVRVRLDIVPEPVEVAQAPILGSL